MHVHVHTHTHTHAHVHTHTHILQVLSSKRYDLEGFAEYARHLRECQTFDEKEATNINYVLRVHSILFRHGIDVPQQDKVASCKLTHTHTHTHTLSKKQNIFMPVIRTYIYLYEM